MPKTVDSFRFISGVTRRMVEAWIKMEEPRPIPWAPLSKPLSECKVALISSGGIAMKDDKPFDQDGERQNPWWGDPSFRTIPKTATEKDVEIYHLHIKPDYVHQDINCLLPTCRLEKLAENGEIGSWTGTTRDRSNGLHNHMPVEYPRPDCFCQCATYCCD